VSLPVTSGAFLLTFTLTSTNVLVPKYEATTETWYFPLTFPVSIDHVKLPSDRNRMAMLPIALRLLTLPTFVGLPERSSRVVADGFKGT